MARLDERTWAVVTAHKDTKLDSPASAEAIAGFEAAHVVTLSPSHRAFLQRGNGGIVGYVRLFGVGRVDRLDLGRMMSEMRPYIEGMADGAILPFATDRCANGATAFVSPTRQRGLFALSLAGASG